MKKIIASLAAAFCYIAALAQQNLMGTAVELKLPDIHEDNTVTFRVYAPKKGSYDHVDYLRSKSYPVQVLWTDGAHTWKNWRNYIIIFAGQLFK